MKKKKKKLMNTSKDDIKKLWKKGKKQADETPDFGVTVEDGRYLAKLTGGTTKESSTERAWKYLEWQFEVTEGDSVGEIIYRRTGLETEDNIAFLIRDLNKLDVDTDDLEINSTDDIDNVMAELVQESPIVRLRLKTNNDGYQNVFIDKLIEGSSSPEGSDDDDINDLVGEVRGFKKGKKMLVGKIISVDEDDSTFVMKTDAGKKVSGEINDLLKSQKRKVVLLLKKVTESKLTLMEQLTLEKLRP
jgi:hypothetical protein